MISRRIDQMQGELNQLVGVNTLGMSHEPHSLTSKKWVRLFMQQFAGEAMELRDNFYHKWWSKEVRDKKVKMYSLRSREKAVVELIDMLHFYVSALQCLGYPPAWAELWADTNTPEFRTDEEAYNAVMYLAAAGLTEELPNRFRRVSAHMRGLFKFFGLSDESLLGVYERKHEINVLRQRNGYSVDTKTEADNEALEDDIRKGQV